MGRPLNKKHFGNDDGSIKITRHYFTGGTLATTDAWILNQRSSNKFTVTDGTTTEVLTLVNKANVDIAEGEMEIDAILDDSTTVQVTRLYGRKIQYEGGTANVAKVRWAAGEHPGADNTGANVDAF